MLIKKSADIPSSEITPKSLYLNRRKFLSRHRAWPAAAAMVPFSRVRIPFNDGARQRQD